MQSVTLTYTLEELAAAAEKVLDSSSHKIILFDAGMGVGKTTLIKELCKQLGVKDSISSPTYSIVNEYQGDNNLVYHFDFYRIKNTEEAYDIGFEEYVDSGEWLLIEWPDKIKSLLPTFFSTVKIVLEENGNRTLKITDS